MNNTIELSKVKL